MVSMQHFINEASVYCKQRTSQFKFWESNLIGCRISWPISFCHTV